MFSYNFKNGLFRIDSDWFFESRYVCFTLINFEVDKDVLSTSVSLGILGLHATLVWR